MDGHAYAAVILAGGAGRRLGGPAKPTLAVAGTPMLLRVLAAVEAARVRVVVGPPSLAPVLPPAVRLTQEQPSGGGPVAGLAAGLAVVTGEGPVAVLAADLPLLSARAIALALTGLGEHDGAVYVDGDGRRQWLCGVWQLAALRRRLADLATTGPLAGRSLRELLSPLGSVALAGSSSGASQWGDHVPWYDCDTPEELAAADRLHRHGKGD